MAPKAKSRDKKALDLSSWQSVRSNCSESTVTCSRCKEPAAAWKSTRRHYGVKPVDCAYAKCSCGATLPKFKGDDAPKGSRGNRGSDGSRTQGDDEELLDKDKIIKDLQAKLLAAQKKPGAKPVTVIEDEVKDDKATQKIKSLHEDIKQINVYMAQLKQMGAEVVKKNFGGDLKPLLDAEAAKRDVLYAQIADLKPPNEKVKLAQNWADQLAKQATAAAKGLEEKQNALDQAKEKLKVAQDGMDKQTASVAEIRSKLKAANDRLTATKADSKSEPDVAADEEKGVDHQLLLLFAAAAKANPTAVSGWDPKMQQRIHSILLDKEKAEEDSRNRPPPPPAQPATSSTSPASKAGDEKEDETMDADAAEAELWKMAEDSNPIMQDEEPTVHEERVRASHSCLAKSKKEFADFQETKKAKTK